MKKRVGVFHKRIHTHHQCGDIAIAGCWVCYINVQTSISIIVDEVCCFLACAEITY